MHLTVIGVSSVQLDVFVVSQGVQLDVIDGSEGVRLEG